MSKEKAMEYLDYARSESGPEAIQTWIGKAIKQLRTAKDEEPIPFLEEVVETLTEHLTALADNLPEYRDSPEEKAVKFAICEAQLITIAEFAKQGLKARQKGSGRSAEERMIEQADHNLQEFETTVAIDTHDGHPVETTMEKLEAVAEAVAADPRIKALKEGR